MSLDAMQPLEKLYCTLKRKEKKKKKDNIIMKVVLTLQVACEWAPQAFPNPSLRSTGLNLCTSAKSFEQQDEEMAHILSKRT